MKRVVALVITLVVLTCSCVLPVFAAEKEVKSLGGLDFHSITIHYSDPIVVSYNYEKKAGYTFADPVKEYTIQVTENAENQIINYGEDVLKSKKTSINYYAINCADLEVNSSNLALTKYPTQGAAITCIGNKTALKVSNSVNLLGAAEYYDDAGTINPNFIVDEATGYFVDSSKDSKGNNNLIDANGFVIDSNNVWHDSTGRRVEAFVENHDGTFVWIPVSARLDDQGKIMKKDDMTNEYFVEKGVLTAIPDFDESKDYDGNGTKGDKQDKSAYKDIKKRFESKSSNIQFFRIDFKDMNGDGKKTGADLDAYNQQDLVFTEADIMTQKNAQGIIQKITGTPVVGIPKVNATITGITIDIDAQGTQVYSDAASDPQQKNTIILTSGNIYENILKADEIVKNSNGTLVNSIGKVIGTAKGVTTRTALDKENATYKTVSFDVSEDTLAGLFGSQTLFLNFYVETEQSTDGIDLSDYTFTDKNNKLQTYKQALITEKNLDKAEETDEESGLNITLIIIIAAAVVVIAAVIVVIIILSKKKKKSAPAAEKAE